MKGIQEAGNVCVNYVLLKLFFNMPIGIWICPKIWVTSLQSPVHVTQLCKILY